MGVNPVLVRERSGPPAMLAKPAAPKSQPAVAPGPSLPILWLSFGSAAVPLTDGSNPSLPLPTKASGSLGCSQSDAGG